MCIWTFPLLRGQNLSDCLKKRLKNVSFYHFLIKNCISRPDLFIAGTRPGQVQPEAPAESPGRGGVVLGAPLHLVELQHDVPGV